MREKESAPCVLRAGTATVREEDLIEKQLGNFPVSVSAIKFPSYNIDRNVAPLDLKQVAAPRIFSLKMLDRYSQN
jgi:hypothetical protein